MSTLIQAKIVKKRWLDWARDSLHHGSRAEVGNARSVLENLQKLKSGCAESLSYEISNVSITEAISAITSALKHLGVDLRICVAGEPLEPAVLQLANADIDPLLREGAQVEKTIAFAPAALDGLLVVDMPSIIAPSELLVSGCGSMERLVVEIQRSLSGGSLFRGN